MILKGPADDQLHGASMSPLETFCSEWDEQKHQNQDIERVVSSFIYAHSDNIAAAVAHSETALFALSGIATAGFRSVKTVEE